eukprot:Skav220018  [mRNA]  locus=scaffold3413:15748:16476:- [translate_table: standard]
MLPQLGALQGSPPPELNRYKKYLYLLVAFYSLIVVANLTVGAVNSALNYVFMLVAAASMVSRADQCMMQCLPVLFLLGIISAFFDCVNIVSLLAAPYPGAKNFFSTDCPQPVEAYLRANTTIYLQNGLVNGTAAYTIPARTKVEIEEHVCNAGWVARNVIRIVGAVLDVAASRLAFVMLRSTWPQQGFDDQGMTQQMMPVQGGDGPPGPGRTLGPGGGPGGMQMRQGPALQPFQGTGHRVGN